MVRLAVDTSASRPSGDDLEALADAVREAARTPPPSSEDLAESAGRPVRDATSAMEVARRGHLRILRSPEQ
ncbi:hypothetical protein SXIM_18160 [Streptomyces xiamenensis]|uniref:Uncharacterized protein n=1 Tax=Streptomyces xiamenensis TaxID=408015 RepID=A0A0F7FU09_9ACTN|nr:hypothetical protein SXIM_18160 [Streptomyces xiamenensis]